MSYILNDDFDGGTWVDSVGAQHSGSSGIAGTLPSSSIWTVQNLTSSSQVTNFGPTRQGWQTNNTNIIYQDGNSNLVIRMGPQGTYGAGAGYWPVGSCATCNASGTTTYPEDGSAPKYAISPGQSCEVRVKTNPVNGLWPAVWFEAAAGAWGTTAYAEIDLMESGCGGSGSPNPSQTRVTIWGGYPTNQYRLSLANPQPALTTLGTGTGGYDIFRVDLYGSYFNIFINGTQVYTLSSSQAAANWTANGNPGPAPWPFTSGQWYVILEVETDSTLSGNPTGTLPVTSMLVDYVRMWSPAGPDPNTSSTTKIATLTDSFPGTSLNGTLWTSSAAGGVIAVNNGLSLTDAASSATYTTITSSALYDLTSSSIYINLASAGTQQAGTQAVLGVVNTGSNNGLYLLVSNGLLTVEQNLAGTYSTPATATYNSGTMAWLKISEAAGTVTFAYAASSSGPWTSLYSMADPFALSSVNVFIQEGTNVATSPAATSVWRSLNTGSSAATASPATLHASAAFPAVSVTSGTIHPALLAVTTSLPPVTVTGTLASGGLTESSVAAWTGSDAGNAHTSGSFTPAANSLLVAVCATGNANGITVTGVTVTDNAGGTWTQIARAGAGAVLSDASIWVKNAGTSPPTQAVTVTFSPSGVIAGGIAVRQFTGAATAASQIGVSVSGTGTTGSITITPGTSGSQVVGAYGGGNGTTMTANGATTLYGQSSAGVVTEAGFGASALSTGGTPVTVGFTATQTGAAIVAAEIRPAVGAAHPGVAALTGSGTLTGTGVFRGAATLTGAGTLTGTGTHISGLRGTGSAALSGSGTLTGTATGIYAQTAVLSGLGTFTATWVGLRQSAPVTLSGSGTLGVSGVIRRYPAALFGQGTLSVLQATGGLVFASPGATTPQAYPGSSQVAVAAPGSSNWMYLGSVGVVTDLKYSFTCPGGADKLTCTIMVPATYRTQLFNPGWKVRVTRGGHIVWAGQVVEPVPSAAGWTLTATGDGNRGQDFLALYTSTWPASQPDESVSAAISRGLPWVNPGIGVPSGAWFGQQVDSAGQTITALLNLVCTRGGLTWMANSQPGGLPGTDINVFPLPVTPNRLLVVSDATPRTLGGDINTIVIRYQATADTSADGGTTATYGTVTAVNSASVAAHGVIETYLDLSDVGVQSSAAALTVGNNILAIYKRASFTQPISGHYGELMNMGGVPIDPGTDQAGTCCRAILTDYGYGGEVAPGSPIQFVTGAYEWDDFAMIFTLTPMVTLDTSLSGMLSMTNTVMTPLTAAG